MSVVPSPGTPCKSTCARQSMLTSMRSMTSDCPTITRPTSCLIRSRASASFRTAAASSCPGWPFDPAGAAVCRSAVAMVVLCLIGPVRPMGPTGPMGSLTSSVRRPGFGGGPPLAQAEPAVVVGVERLEDAVAGVVQDDVAAGGGEFRPAADVPLHLRPEDLVVAVGVDRLEQPALEADVLLRLVP